MWRAHPKDGGDLQPERKKLHSEQKEEDPKRPGVGALLLRGPWIRPASAERKKELAHER